MYVKATLLMMISWHTKHMKPKSIQNTTQIPAYRFDIYSRY